MASCLPILPASLPPIRPASLVTARAGRLSASHCDQFVSILFQFYPFRFILVHSIPISSVDASHPIPSRSGYMYDTLGPANGPLD